MKRPLAAALAAMTLCLCLGACARSHQITQGRPYPQQMRRGTTLDIQVIRRGTSIELTNTTARSFGPSILWINGRFSNRIEGLAIGEKLDLPLRQFRDQYNERFRAGGFFATEKPELLALAELQPESGGEIFGLVVVGERE